MNELSKIFKNYSPLIVVFFSLSPINCQQKTSPPSPYGSLPTSRQIKWQELEMISIVHFGLNTFANKEWGYGDLEPYIFNPSAFDPNQIVSAAKAAGIRGIILVAKHHDGFCLWPTQTTDYNITRSPWKNGEGDIVKAFEDACRNQGLKFGIYCSPWDRNSQYYGTAEYLEIYREQLKELYSNYGPLFESWHDGANGGDGYYGGTNRMNQVEQSTYYEEQKEFYSGCGSIFESWHDSENVDSWSYEREGQIRKIDRSTYYDWDSTWKITRRMQPEANIFSDAGWDVRWVGNEHGYAADTCWETFTPLGENGSKASPGNVQYRYSPIGTRNGKYWMPAECDVPLRSGWFWNSYSEDVKSAEKLFDIYMHSVGRSANLNLGLAPDTNGRLSTVDVLSLKRLGILIRETFSKNLAQNAIFKASNVRGNNRRRYGTENLIDGDYYSYWATDDSVHTPVLEVNLEKPQTFNIIQLRENIKLGQRISKVAIDQWQNGAWHQIATATGVGANRLIKLSSETTTKRVRLRIVDSPVCIALSSFGLYRELHDDELLSQRK